MPRKRRPRRSFAGKANGRKMFWLRSDAMSLTTRVANAAIYTDIIIDPADYEDPEVDLNNTRKGGARLERLIVDCGFATDGDLAFYTASGEANIAAIPELMIWAQSDQFITTATGVTSWDQTKANQRILVDELMPVKTMTHCTDTAIFRQNEIKVDIRSKVRLAEMSIGLGIRGHFDATVASLNGFSDWYRFTALISTP